MLGNKALLAALVLILSLGRSPASLKMPISAHEMMLKGFGNGNRDMILALRGGGNKNSLFSYLRQKMGIHRRQDRKLLLAAEVGQVWRRLFPRFVSSTCGLHVLLAIFKRHALG
jgi:hypothetical protein